MREDANQPQASPQRECSRAAKTRSVEKERARTEVSAQRDKTNGTVFFVPHCEWRHERRAGSRSEGPPSCTAAQRNRMPGKQCRPIVSRGTASMRAHGNNQDISRCQWRRKTHWRDAKNGKSKTGEHKLTAEEHSQTECSSVSVYALTTLVMRPLPSRWHSLGSYCCRGRAKQ